MFGPRRSYIGFSWPSVDDVISQGEKLADEYIPDSAGKAVRDAAQNVVDKARSSYEQTKDAARGQLELLSQKIGEDVGKGATTSLKKGFTPWIVGGAVVAIAAFLVLRGRR